MRNAQLSLQATLAIMPLAIAIVPWGMLTGALALEVGLTPWQAQLTSLLIYAGATQLSCLSQVANAASAGVIFASTMVINARHLLYSVVFRQYVLGLPLPWRLAIGFVLTDEVFAVSQAHTSRNQQFSPLFMLVAGVTFYLVWNLATALGIIIGGRVEELSELGLDFAIVATFIAITFDALRRLPVVLAILISGTSSVLLKPFLADSYIIIAAITGMVAAFIVSNEEKV